MEKNIDIFLTIGVFDENDFMLKKSSGSSNIENVQMIYFI